MSREMRHSGIDWIGEIPKEWRVKRIKHSCKLFGRIGFRGYTADDLVNEGEGAITLSPSNMDGIKLDFSHCSYLSWDKYEESPEIKVAVGDVLLVKTASVGKCAYVDNLPMECTVNPQILVLKEHRDCSKFIAYIFQTPLGQAYIDVTKGGTTISTISQEKIGNYEFAFPPISEQQKIANYLDKVCGEVDEMIALQEQMIEELKAYKQSVITEAVTKGLNPGVPMKDSGIDWIGEVPEGWLITKAKFFVTIGNGSDPKTEGDIPVYGSGSASFKTCGEYKMGPTVLIGRKGATLHIPHYIEGKYWNVDTAFDVKSKGNISLRYYYFLAICFDYKYYISQTTLPGMAQSSYNNMEIPVPPLEEQQTIASYLDTKCAEIDALIAIKQQKIDELKDYKKSVIYEYVTGKKEVV